MGGFSLLMLQGMGVEHMTLDVNQENMTIMGVVFENRLIFKSVWYALSTNMIEGWQPTVEDVELLRDEAIALVVA